MFLVLHPNPWRMLHLPRMLSGLSCSDLDLLVNLLQLLCSVFSHGLFSVFFAAQRDYCKDCYAECALNGRSLPRMPPEEQTF